ncbi:EF-hand domain-containing protein [Gilvimarinus algae]|uniref:EF-hand domain-containing protein n=1 Tax=Gilvimarinus algae TaxID=3058037 RepID=A0ABT8TH97_9GAMM|nr:EF-hand domain-containing protein [Gilvimarinus sp. SDUM040014]MDO3383286.1 EF-hand domain-containing protein [Gilvimarinus sp. SDUM040014]
MKKLSALTMSLLLSLGALTAVADDTGNGDTGAKSAFAMADKNSDGSVDKSEARTSGIDNDRFEKLDKNGDGKLSESEYRGADRGTSGGW